MLKRLLGLDPARPMYDQMGIGLNRSNAQFVQVLHTDPGDIGTSLLRGDADFFASKYFLSRSNLIVDIMSMNVV